MNRFVVGHPNAYLVVMVEKTEDLLIFHRRSKNGFIIRIRDYALSIKIHKDRNY